VEVVDLDHLFQSPQKDAILDHRREGEKASLKGSIVVKKTCSRNLAKQWGRNPFIGKAN
jgi:hypothetical protein